MNDEVKEFLVKAVQIVQWIAKVLKTELDVDLCDSLKSGII